MQLAVLEYLCGGGLVSEGADVTNRHELQGLFQEGFGMLRSLIEDLAACGHSVATVIDPQAMERGELNSLRTIASVHLLDDKDSGSDGFLSHWIRVARKVDRALVIAPEIDGELLRITQAMRASGVAIWGASDSFLAHGCDKLASATTLSERSGYPQTWSVMEWLDATQRNALSLKKISEEGWVLKDRFGAGCNDIRWFSDTPSLMQFLESRQGVYAEEPLGKRNRNHWMVQQWVPGRSASLSCLASPGGGVRLVGCMGQSIERTESVRYSGGDGPLWPEHHDFLQAWVERTVAPFVGVCGWFGLDVVIAPTGEAHGNTNGRPLDVQLIEINPRLTTSYVGWRELVGPALAEGVLGISDTWAGCRRIEKQVTFRLPSLP